MGYDLKPIRPSTDLLCNEDGPLWQRYGCLSWSYLSQLVNEYKLYPLPQTNDGYLIGRKKCIAIANIIESNKQRLVDDGMEHLKDDYVWWRSCGGCRVY